MKTSVYNYEKKKQLALSYLISSLFCAYVSDSLEYITNNSAANYTMLIITIENIFSVEKISKKCQQFI